LYTKSGYVTDYKGLLSGVVLSFLMGILAELFRFIKWYVSIKHRVTSNCLQSIITGQQVQEMDINLKIWVISLFVLHRSIQLLLAVQIMMSYNLLVMVATCLG
jgi:hypothetical protein